MHHIDHNSDKAYVATYKELIFIFVVFIAILVVLNPKDLIKEQVLSEKSNYDLSILYLKNILEQEPENEEIMLLLAEQSLSNGDKDLSIRLLGLLLQSKNKLIRTKVTFLSYDLLKDDYYYLENKDETELLKMKDRLKELLLKIIDDNVYEEEDIRKWYDEAVFLDYDFAKYVFIKQLLAKDTQNVELIKIAYYLAVEFKNVNDTTDYIHRLAQYDIENSDKWKRDEYYTLIMQKQYERAEVLLLVYSETSLEWKIRLAEFYLMRAKYKKASKIYIDLFNASSDYIEKKNYFFKAARALQGGNLLKETAALARSYESYYAKDREVRNFLLKIYMATGYLDYAFILSKQILDKETSK